MSEIFPRKGILAMNSIKMWLDLAKAAKLSVINISDTPETSLCINLISIPKSDAVAVTITVMKDQKKKNALPPWVFSKVMGVVERTLRDIDESMVQSSQFFKPIGLDTEWYKVLNCHRIFFIPETSVSDFIATFLSRSKLNLVKSQGVSEVFLVVDTLQYYFSSSF